ncbi:MAG: SDR family NAD(P)-dependent oxidoreductase, partial [Chromatocurvus sp.]
KQKKLMFMGSAAGSTGGLQAPYMMFAYCGSKSALHNMVRGLHLNLHDEGITVGLLEPGVVDTQGFRNVQPGEPAPYGLDHVVELVRQGKLEFADPKEAVSGLRALIARMTPADGGRLTRVDGEVLPW